MSFTSVGVAAVIYGATALYYIIRHTGIIFISVGVAAAIYGATIKISRGSYGNLKSNYFTRYKGIGY